MRIPVMPGRTTTIVWLLGAVVLVVALFDSGSVALNRMQASTDAQNAARSAVLAIANKPLNQATAQIAWQAAEQSLPSSDTLVRNTPVAADRFTLNQNGSVTLTVTRVAFTLVFKYFGFVRKYTHITETYTQQPTSY